MESDAAVVRWNLGCGGKDGGEGRPLGGYLVGMCPDINVNSKRIAIYAEFVEVKPGEICSVGVADE